MKKIVFFAATAMIVLGMTACNCSKKQKTEATEVSKSTESMGLTNQHWKLTELIGKTIENQTPEAYIVFNDDGTVNGCLGCNRFNGTYTLQEGNRIRFSELANTQMMCLNMDVETELRKVLQTVDNYYLSEGKLILNRARMAPLAHFEAVAKK